MEERSLSVIRISVRNLVEFVLRSGDLDNRRTAGAKKEAMQAGGRLHRKIQKRMGSEYRAEVSLKHTVDEEEFKLLVEGRADGVIEEAAGCVIDEIKCIYMDLKYLEDADPVHLAQAKCYAYFLACDRELAAMGVQITYCNIESEEVRRFRFDYSFEELEEWFLGLVHEYVKWARFQYLHGLRRQQSLKDLQFPYAYRDGQKGLAAAVYRSIDQGRNLFIQAPTGVGKTLSTVFPSLKAMGEGSGDKLFYLTAKSITRSVAEDAFRVMRDLQQLYFTTVTITAKEKLCVLDKPDCNPETCPVAKGHYDRVNDAVYDILHEEMGITRELVLEYAKRHNVCPFEFCLDITNWADGIICDYNYVFDPNVRLKRYFAEGSTPGEYLFLVDEAHNLVPRAREMFSAGLLKEDFLLVKRILKGKDGAERTVRQRERCNKELLNLKRAFAAEEGGEEGVRQRSVLGRDYQLLEDVNLLYLELSGLFSELEAFMNEHLEFGDRDLVLDFYFQVRDFLYVHDRLDDNYRIYSWLLEDGSFLVKLMCINPSVNLRECLDQGRSTLFFSATLLPIQYYKELRSGDQSEYAGYANSPFDSENRLIVAASDVSSIYRRRNRREYERVAGYIVEIVGARKGNYMVFCPSYQYLHAVEEVFVQLEERGELPFAWISQSSHMREEEREEFLARFARPGDGRSLAALCVMGGIFSEGIDLKEEQLIGAIVIGTGLPQVNVEQEILREYFDEHGGQGFSYAYQYPGMNKVMQAAGRVIRTATDQGVIALLDDRFLKSDYQALFPREWERYTVVNRRNVRRAVADFWEHLGNETPGAPKDDLRTDLQTP